MTEYLSNQDDLFTQDGAVGTFHLDRTRTRVISDSPELIRLAQQLLVKVSSKDVDAARSIVIYHQAKPTPNSGPHGMLFFNPEGSPTSDEAPCVSIVLQGQVAPSDFLQVILQAKSILMEADETRKAFLLPCDAIRTAEGKSALVFHASDASRKSSLAEGTLYCAHGTIWSQEGLTAVVNGKLTEDGQEQNNSAAALAIPTPNLIEPPSYIVFVMGNQTKGDDAVNMDQIMTPELQKIAKSQAVTVHTVTKETEIPHLLK